MAKRPTIPCRRCGTMLWPDNRLTTPPESRLCRTCASAARVAPLTWELQRNGPVSTLILDSCRSCGAMPELLQRFTDGQPRALSWTHKPECTTTRGGAT